MGPRELIVQADTIARSQGHSQASWSRLAGFAVTGQTVSRILARGECKLGTFTALLDALGYELVIIEKGGDHSGIE